jgi:hypothetical protein
MYRRLEMPAPYTLALTDIKIGSSSLLYGNNMPLPAHKIARGDAATNWKSLSWHHEYSSIRFPSTLILEVMLDCASYCIYITWIYLAMFGR